MCSWQKKNKQKKTQQQHSLLSPFSLSPLFHCFPPSLSFVLLFVFIFLMVCVLMMTVIVFIVKLVRHCWRHFVRYIILCDDCNISLCLLMIALILYHEYLLNKIVFKPTSYFPKEELRGWLAAKTQWWILFLTRQASPSRGWDVKVYILGYSPTELAHSFYSLLVVYFCLCGSFEYISFFKLSQQYSIFSFCSSHFCPICLIGPFSCISLYERLRFR